jgi:hypothetical protein
MNKRKPRRFCKVGGVCRISIPNASYWWSSFLPNQRSDEHGNPPQLRRRERVHRVSFLMAEALLSVETHVNPECVVGAGNAADHPYGFTRFRPNVMHGEAAPGFVGSSGGCLRGPTT